MTGYHGSSELSWRPVNGNDGPSLHPLLARCYSGAWSLQELNRFLRSEHVGGLVAVEDDADYCGPAGMLLYTWHRPQATWQIEILAVQPKARRRGIASQLLLELQGPLRYHKAHEHLACAVSETNLAGQLLLRSCGFYLAAVLKSSQPAAGSRQYQLQTAHCPLPAQDRYLFAYDRIALRLSNLWPPDLRKSREPRVERQEPGRRS